MGLVRISDRNSWSAHSFLSSIYLLTMKYLEKIKQIFEPPSAEVLAIRELEAARRSLLEAQSAREYADSMAKYHEARIRRLTNYLHTMTGENE